MEEFSDRNNMNLKINLPSLAGPEEIEFVFKIEKAQVKI